MKEHFYIRVAGKSGYQYVKGYTDTAVEFTVDKTKAILFYEVPPELESTLFYTKELYNPPKKYIVKFENSRGTWFAAETGHGFRDAHCAIKFDNKQAASLFFSNVTKIHITSPVTKIEVIEVD
jgi:hypothetical protein